MTDDHPGPDSPPDPSDAYDGLDQAVHQYNAQMSKGFDRMHERLDRLERLIAAHAAESAAHFERIIGLVKMLQARGINRPGSFGTGNGGSSDA